MAIVRVNNTEPNLKNIGLPQAPDKAGVDQAAAVKLFPGWNEVDVGIWERAKTNPIVQHWIKEKILVVEGDAKTPADAIGDLDNAEAVALVKDTTRVDLLRSWQAQEQRGDVLQAILDQIELIENPKA